MSNKIKIDETDLLTLLVAASKTSCGFDKVADANRLWEYHCCDYNESIYKAAKQLARCGFKDERYNSFIAGLIIQGDKYYE